LLPGLTAAYEGAVKSERISSCVKIINSFFICQDYQPCNSFRTKVNPSKILNLARACEGKV
jgi:hypothetical protein